MKLKEFVNARVEMVDPRDTLQRAAEKMGELDIGSLIGYWVFACLRQWAARRNNYGP